MSGSIACHRSGMGVSHTGCWRCTQIVLSTEIHRADVEKEEGAILVGYCELQVSLETVEVVLALKADEQPQDPEALQALVAQAVAKAAAGATCLGSRCVSQTNIKLIALTVGRSIGAQ